MSDSSQTPVQSAFEQLLEEIEEEFTDVNSAGTEAFKAGKYDRVKELGERGEQLRAFRDKVVALRQEWEVLVPLPRPPVIAPPTPGKRSKRGLRTPEHEYFTPILQALDEVGGSANIKAVLNRVEQLMKGKLSDYDYQPLRSDPALPRWRNAAQWARDSLVKQGLLRNDSPRGTWELSDAGRKRLGK